MITIKNKNQKDFLLKAVVDKDIESFVIKKDGIITDDVNKKLSYVYFKKSLTIKKLKSFAISLINVHRNYQIDVNSFITDEIDENKFIMTVVENYEFKNAKNIYNQKSKKNSNTKNITLINISKTGEEIFKKAKFYAENVNWVRNLQVMPPNILNSEKLADIYFEEFKKYNDISIKVLDKKEIKEQKMNLILAVNSASKYEPRVVIVEYKGNLKSKNKTIFIGKGITFDGGGMNIKTGKSMLGMKYDMSGSAIVMGAMRAIIKLKPKVNIGAIVALTDNVISSKATMPDSVYRSMSGKTVEINNTDAEGRLVMADAITYAIKKVKATRIIDVATLTGAVIVSLGTTYTGVWSTTDKGWKDVKAAAKKVNELVWRMPLHSDYFEFMKSSKVADMFNTDYTGKGGSSSAAMFLTQFSENIEHIHLDIAGTADIKGIPMAPMVKTLIKLVTSEK